MQPGSVTFLVFMAIVTVAALVLAVWTWSWERLRFVRRLGALAFTQVMVVVTVLVAVNVWQGFFVTWDDLILGGQGGDPEARPVVALPPSPEPGQRPTAEVAHQLWPAVRAGARVAARRPGGVMVATAIRGPRTGYMLPARIYFPAAYFDKSQPNRIFPVIEFFTGYYGGLDIFQRTLGGDQVMDKLIEHKKMPPTIVIIPEQNPHLPADSECVDAVGGDKADTYVALDVVDVVRNDLRVSKDRSQWALMGYSTGGFCAANLALRHPGRFSSVISMSGYFHPVTDRTTGDLYRGSTAVKLANTPKYTIGLPRKYALKFYLTAGGGDNEGIWGMQELVPGIKPPDQLTKVMTGKGGHNFGVWRRQLPDAFIWAGRAFSVAPGNRSASPNPRHPPASPSSGNPPAPPSSHNPSALSGSAHPSALSGSAHPSALPSSGNR